MLLLERFQTIDMQELQQTSNLLKFLPQMGNGYPERGFRGFKLSPMESSDFLFVCLHKNTAATHEILNFVQENVKNCTLSSHSASACGRLPSRRQPGSAPFSKIAWSTPVNHLHCKKNPGYAYHAVSLISANITILTTVHIIIIIIKRLFIRFSNIARVTTRAPYNVRCSYSGNS